ncbi:hypothetical protein NPX13_g8164 [Xylaria arbuscula]|uniref:Uncharacterized protein n=1 Tax=Xylaria arbuscula TaxID=114810 RepID=A0A9W8TKF2_9PEZI|nr:hypothetical protein NPX13_g8164 [Xylaria arbuscula]
MADVNLNKSYGSCWSNVNVALEDDYIPCGNADSGNSYACCHYGDNCLSSNACYHGKCEFFLFYMHLVECPGPLQSAHKGFADGITYLAGCTDQDFSGPACQNKGKFFNQSWVGLTRCDPDKNAWAGCPEEDGVVGSSPPTSNCKCKEETVLFEDMPMLDNIASLPQRLGGSISWFPGHTPTRTSSASTKTSHSSISVSQGSGEGTTQSSTDGLTESALPTSITSPTLATATAPANAHATRLNAGAKAGIAVGSVIGALLVAFLVTILIRKRRAAKANPSVQPFLPTTEPEPEPIQPEPSAPTFSTLGGFKAELPAEGPPSANSLAPSSIPNSPSPSPVIKSIASYVNDTNSVPAISAGGLCK